MGLGRLGRWGARDLLGLVLIGGDAASWLNLFITRILST